MLFLTILPELYWPDVVDIYTLYPDRSVRGVVSEFVVGASHVRVTLAAKTGKALRRKKIKKRLMANGKSLPLRVSGRGLKVKP